VEEIAAERAWGGSRDLVGLIEALKRAFDVAITLKSAAGMAAARAIVAEAARLKQLLPPDPVLPDPRIVDLTDEEWTARYGPPAP
jgi:HPt (histidine-containing phosphotransfer) domain-containing protein